jgi:hypothetical protein
MNEDYDLRRSHTEFILGIDSLLAYKYKKKPKVGFEQAIFYVQ